MFSRILRVPFSNGVPRRNIKFSSGEDYLTYLSSISDLPLGFNVGTHTFSFNPREVPEKKANMTMTLIALDKPTPSFSAMFTTSAFPGAPVIVGRELMAEAGKIQAVLINNKISNVCAPDGVADTKRLCKEVASYLQYPSADYVFPSSTGIIGWKLPVDDMVKEMPNLFPKLQNKCILPAAKGICTTDLFPKIRAVELPNGSRIVGIAKGAGMVEPGLATMLVYLLTDAEIDRLSLQSALKESVEYSFNSLSIDSDMSTSDTVLALSSNKATMPSNSLPQFGAGLQQVCWDLANDIARNGEGVQHVIRVEVKNSISYSLARHIGKSVVNSPLFKTAVAGNDPNVGRLVAAIGKCVQAHPEGALLARQMDKVSITMGGHKIFSNNQFHLNPETEVALVQHLKDAQLWSKSFAYDMLP